MAPTNNKPTTAAEVLLYYPNLLGYARAAMIVASTQYATSSWPTFVALYFAQFFCDLVDGWLARRLGQCSRFGALLDMIVDRVGTATVHMVLGHLYVVVLLLLPPPPPPRAAATLTPAPPPGTRACSARSPA